MKEEKKRIAFFGLFESFFESAPQILLQFYLIMIKIDKDDDSISKFPALYNNNNKIL